VSSVQATMGCGVVVAKVPKGWKAKMLMLQIRRVPVEQKRPLFEQEVQLFRQEMCCCFEQEESVFVQTCHNLSISIVVW